jgi:hypothetical protein
MEKKKKWTAWGYESVASAILKAGHSGKWGEKSTQSAGASLLWMLLDENTRNSLLEIMLVAERRANAAGSTVLEEMRKMRDGQGRIPLPGGDYFNLSPMKARVAETSSAPPLGKQTDNDPELTLRAAEELAATQNQTASHAKVRKPSRHQAG